MAATKIAVPPVSPVVGHVLAGQVGAEPLETLCFSNPPGNSEIVMVWAHNLQDEMERLRDEAEIYDHVALETQFAGLVARPTGPFSDYLDYNYQTLKCNVDLARVMQLTVTLADSKGNRPKKCTWRFNFRFDPSRDLLPPDSSEMQGLDLKRHSTHGIEPPAFAELLMNSGLVLNEDIRWITYGSLKCLAERPCEEGRNSRYEDKPWISYRGMYDFGYMLQLLTSQPLPGEVRGYHEALDLFFPSRCDVAKHLHRLGLAMDKNGEGVDMRTRSHFRHAHYLLEAFFRLPESIRKNAFEKEESPVHPVKDEPMRHAPGRRRRDQTEQRSC